MTSNPLQNGNFVSDGDISQYYSSHHFTNISVLLDQYVVHLTFVQCCMSVTSQ